MENIKQILTEIESHKKIKILYACETGSRAWGFPSPDSDYDIRFVYMHERDWYLSLSPHKDSIEIMDGDLDISGWDLRKCLMLLKKSNAALIERFQSPIEYYALPGFKADFKELVQAYYSPVAVFYHHYSLATNFWEELKYKEEYKLKNVFYMVRSLLSCNWISEDNSLLPMDIFGLMQYVSPEQIEKLNELIKLKAAVGEKYLHPKDTLLNEWIEEWFKKAASVKDKLDVNKTAITLLNQFFLKMLYATDN
jgi:uncharacterized protein